MKSRVPDKTSMSLTRGQRLKADDVSNAHAGAPHSARAALHAEAVRRLQHLNS